MSLFPLYANRSNARRAAKAAGLELDFLVFGQYDRNGVIGWGWEPAAKPIQAVLRSEPVNLPQPAPKAAPAPVASAAATPKHKDFSVYDRSTVLSPVQFIKKFLNEKGSGLTRKEALYALSQHGVNYATARTQYQIWFRDSKQG